MLPFMNSARHGRSALQRFALGTTLLCLAATASVAAGPFSAFHGTWSGRGNAIFNGGVREKLMCKGYYSGKDASLSLALRCASPSNKIDLRAKLNGAGSTVSGSWEERTFNASGAVTGSVADTRLNLKLDGGISGKLTVSLGDNSQLVSLNTDGSSLTGVHLKLTRR